MARRRLIQQQHMRFDMLDEQYTPMPVDEFMADDTLIDMFDDMIDDPIVEFDEVEFKLFTREIA